MFGLDALIGGIFQIGGAAQNNAFMAEQANIQRMFDMQMNLANMKLQKEINDENIELQRDLNASNISESEKAYQRSTIQAQIKQFMDAGYSQQQAMQAVLGQSAGQYAAPQLGAASLVAPQIDTSGIDSAFMSQMSNYQSTLAGVGTALSGLGSDLEKSLVSPDGGSIGAFVANDALSFLTEHLHELSPENRSFFGLRTFLDSDSAPDHWKEFGKSDSWKKVQRSIFGRKALGEFFRQSFNFSSSDENLEGLRLANWQARRNKALRELTFDEETKSTQAQYMITQLDAAYRGAVNAYQIDASIESLKEQAGRASLNSEAFFNPTYRQKVLRHMMLDETNAILIARILEAKYTGQSEWLKNPDNAKFYAIGELLDSMGLTRSDIGSVLSVLISGGADVPAAVSDVCEKLNRLLGLGQKSDGAFPTIVEKAVGLHNNVNASPFTPA